MPTSLFPPLPAATPAKASAHLAPRRRIPGVIYGRTRDAQPLSINARELTRLLEHISAENTVIDLTIDGTTARTLIRQIQRHPLKRNILHVDLQELVAGEKVEVRIPLVLQGIPAGVRTSGGILDQSCASCACASTRRTFQAASNST